MSNTCRKNDAPIQINTKQINLGLDLQVVSGVDNFPKGAFEVFRYVLHVNAAALNPLLDGSRSNEAGTYRWANRRRLRKND